MAFDFPAAPTIGQFFQEYYWDGQKWIKSGRGDASIAAAPPANPKTGQLWWDTDSGVLFVFYDDGNSAQWVATDSSGSALLATPSDGKTYGRKDDGWSRVAATTGDRFSGRIDALDAAPGSVSGVIGSRINVAEGAPGTPITTQFAPTFYVSRHESIPYAGTTDGSLGPAILGSTKSYGTQQGVAITGVSFGEGVGDNVAVYGTATQNGAAGSVHTAYGGFFSAHTTVTSVNAGIHGVEIAVTNGSGIDVPYTGISPWPRMSGMHISPESANQHAVGIWLGTHNGLGAKFDVGIAMVAGSVKTAAFQDDSSSANILKATGTHAVGINLSAATFTGPAFASPGFGISKEGTVLPAVNAAVAVSVDTSTGPSVVVANGASQPIAIGFGLLVVHEAAVLGDVSMWLVTGVTAVLVSQTGTFFVASTSTPPAGKASVAWNGSSQAIYNNRGGVSTFYIGQYRT